MDRTNTVLGIIVALLLVASLGVVANLDFEPAVVVNMPADAQPLSQINPVTVDAVVIGNERAVLWWTVYNSTLKVTGSSYAARIAANDALVSVYGGSK
jgi:hypothetical protein